MSQVYSTEPQTSGRVILDTTHGPIEIQLWCRECPTTTKVFLQLCLDGFYDNMAFHRIAPNFLVQTGALRLGDAEHEPFGKTESMTIYRRKVEADEALSRRSYELNSRIRFNHRGQVAMALEADAQDDSTLLQPQFFITLDEASFLDGKHVLFGTVNGPTIFNCLRIGKTDVDDSNQPTVISEAPRIQRVRIMENPIHSDIVPSVLVPWKIKKKEAPKKKKNRRGVKNVNVLSFGDELEVDESQSFGIKSKHQLSEFKTRQKVKEITEKEKFNSSKLEQKTAQLTESVESSRQPINEVDLGTGEIKEMKLVRSSDLPTVARMQSQTRKYGPISRKSSGEALKEVTSKDTRMSLVSARRAKYEQGGNKSKRKREEDTMYRLKLFQSRIAKISSKEESKRQDDGEGYHGQILEHNADDGDWMSTTFQCRKHMDIDAKLGGDGRNALEDYEIIDDVGSRNSQREKIGKRHHRSSKR